ncbi:uncharacterized protein [Cardiocondyla obscurior]|uniref:uncharacterized protein n=1 Tax=Cardiocondyla obscurior TaxID=286306 RepID=UPI003965747D
MVDYIIEGIPDDSIRRQAMMLRFVDKEAMLRGMENISLPTEHKTQQKMEKGATKITGKTTGAYKKSSGEMNVKTEVRCYNCNAEGHMANKCPMPKRERGACFKCYQMGHRAKDCPIKGRPKKEVNSVSTTKGDEESNGMSNGERSEIINSVSNSEIKDFHRKVSYELVDKANDMKISLELDTLLDTGSPISFIKETLVPPKLVRPVSSDKNMYCGLNNSKLQIKGEVKANITLNRKEAKHVIIMVVTERSMKASVAIGRDLLIQFFGKEKSDGKISEDEVIKEILQISINEVNCDVKETININQKISPEIQVSVKKLFENEYVKPNRPEKPKVDAELCLKLRENKPFNFPSNRPSYAEKREL